MSLADVERSFVLLERVPARFVGVETFVVLFRTCGRLRALAQARIAHSHCVRSGHDRVRFLANLLVDMYAKCGAIEDSRRAFDSIVDPDVYSWTIVISAHAQNGRLWDAIHLYRRMHLQGIRGDAFTFTIILGVCSSLGLFEAGRKVHLSVLECGFESEVVVATALVHLYGKCGDVPAAKCAFDAVSEEQRDLPCWCSMIAAFAQNGHCTEAFCVFHQMSLEGVEPNGSIFVSVLTACCSARQGRVLEERVEACGYGSDVFVQTALLTMFGRLHELEDARRVFDRLQCKGTVSWSAMLAVYAQNGQTADALALFRAMDLHGVRPDAVTYINLLSACPSLAEAQRIHSRVIFEGHSTHLMVGTSLVNAYGRFGSLEDARAAFDRMPRKCISTWNALMSAYLHNGQSKEVVQLMEAMNLELDRVTLMCILTACASLGDLQSGLQAYARHATVTSADSTLKTALMNLYGKCGRLDEARALFDETRSRGDVVAWNAMIAAYAQHGHERQAVDLFGEMLLDGVSPNQSSVSNVLCAMSHGGQHLNEALSYFGYIVSDFGIAPDVEHYSSVVDMLGRAGWLQEAEQVLLSMPFLPTETTCLSLLFACKLHGNLDRAARLARGVFFEPGNSAHYVMLSSIFSEAHQAATMPLP